MVSVMVPTIELNDGHAIPELGFGVFKIDPAETAAAGTGTVLGDPANRDTFDRL
jgi:diketogulonate reductase-like aldo/keto reductase